MKFTGNRPNANYVITDDLQCGNYIYVCKVWACRKLRNDISQDFVFSISRDLSPRFSGNILLKRECVCLDYAQKTCNFEQDIPTNLYPVTENNYTAP